MSHSAPSLEQVTGEAGTLELLELLTSSDNNEMETNIETFMMMRTMRNC